jgi:hypothetical protein
MAKKLVRFDWAMKKLLRNKANFSILEGFLTELLKFEVKIQSILESESNKEDPLDKHNRVDILVEATDGELMLVEIQNQSQVDYFQRMIYGVSKLITEYIEEGDPYSSVKKVYSINIVYFGLGQGEDYIYEYNGKFVGKHLGDVLQPSLNQKRKLNFNTLGDIFPKYYVLKVNNFNDVAKDSLDEWIYFLKNSKVKEEFDAKGLKEAGEKLKLELLTQEELNRYRRFQKNRRIEQSELETAIVEGIIEGEEIGMQIGLEKGIEQGIERGIEQGIERVAINALKQGKPVELIMELTGLTAEQLETLQSRL